MKKRQAISKNLPLVLWLEGMMPKKLAILILKNGIIKSVNKTKLIFKDLTLLIFIIIKGEFLI